MFENAAKILPFGQLQASDTSMVAPTAFSSPADMVVSTSGLTVTKSLMLNMETQASKH